MIDVSEVMRDPEFTSAITLRREAGAYSTDPASTGEWTPSYAETQIVAIVQPASPEELLLLEEGERNKNTISVWSVSELRGGDGKRQQPDVLIVDGRYYRVIRVEPRPDGNYFRAVAQGYVP